MKIALVGTFEQRFHRGYHYGVAFQELGHNVECVERPRMSLLDRVFFRAFNDRFPVHTRQYSRQLVERISSVRPDFVMAFGPMYLDALAVRQLAHLARVYCFLYDDISHRNNRTRTLLKAISHYDCIFSIRSFLSGEFRKLGCQDYLFVPPAAAPTVHHACEPSEADRKQFESDVLFIGSYEAPRAAFLERLCSETDFRIRVYGNNWERKPHLQCLKARGALMFREAVLDDAVKAMACTKIAVAFLRQHNRDNITSRTFEIPAYGAFMLHQYSDEISRYFVPGEDVATFSGYDSFKDAVRHYLVSAEERQRMAKRANERMARGGNYIIDRARAILTYHSNGSKFR